MNHLYKYGWMVAAALVAVLLVAGFQETATKIAVVDLSKVVEKSEAAISAQSDLQGMVNARNSFLQFLDSNKVASQEQTLKLKALWLKMAPTAQEKTDLDNLKAEIMKSFAKYQELQQKQNPTPDEQTLMNEFGVRSRANSMTVQRLDGEFAQEMQDKRRDLLQTVVEKARKSVQDVAKAAGYTAVFDIQVAPYGANDLTEATMKAMNAKK